MPPEQDPTQIDKAPNTATPDNQADAAGGGGESPEGEGGKTYDQAYVDRLKQQLEGEKQELNRISTERDTYKNNNELLTTRFNSPATPTPAPVYPQWDPNTFLTPDEDGALATAYENLDHKEITRLNRVASKRENATSQATVLRTIGVAATQAQTINSVTAQLNAAEEFNDSSVREKLLLETAAAMRDPAQVSRYAAGEWNVAGVGVINPHILMDKLKDHRIAQGGAMTKEKGKISPEGHDVMGSEGPGSAHPSAGSDTFNAAEHLTASERSGAVKGMGLKGFPTSGMSDNNEAYKKIWSGLSEDVKAYRLKNGAPYQSPEQREGSAQATIWKAKAK